MLGNFSMGDYFKQGAAEFAWELSLEGFGIEPDKIWATVFEGDEELGLGPDEEAIDAWLAIGVPRERIVLLRRDGELLAGRPDRSVRAVQRAVHGPRPGVRHARTISRAATTSASWSTGTSCSCSTTRSRSTRSRRCPAKNIDTGLGLNRLAAIMQGTTSVFETDQFRPLIDLGEELSGKRYGETFATDRAMRILADHTRGMSFLIADGVVPSNEERGYVLRRLMRRAIVQGRQARHRARLPAASTPTACAS